MGKFLQGKVLHKFDSWKAAEENPMKAIYRFRSADKLLDDQYSEFTRIYLTDRESLNDPMEGFFNITFNGDKILWANLFKHFFQSIWFIWSILRIKHGRHSLSAQDVVIGDHDNWSDDFFYKEEYTNFETYWERFCDVNEMNPIFERLEKCSCPINIAILEIVFTITSPYAMHHVGLLGESGIDLKNIKLSKLLNQIIDGIENDTDTFEHKHDSISAVSKNAIAKRYGKDSIYSKLSKNDMTIRLAHHTLLAA